MRGCFPVAAGLVAAGLAVGSATGCTASGGTTASAPGAPACGRTRTAVDVAVVIRIGRVSACTRDGTEFFALLIRPGITTAAGPRLRWKTR